MSSRRFRWAPTPSGPLHLGNLFSILLTWLEARESGGEILLRIDDLDSTRARPEFVKEIFSVLNALELDWDLGPRSFEEFEREYSQILSQSFYAAAFEEALRVAADLFFACDCSRSDLPVGQPYPGRCRLRGLPFYQDGSVAWRVMSELIPGAPAVLGDVVLYRKEKIFAYHWVSIQEDLRWGITDIHRGQDLRTSTELQSAFCQELARRGQEKYAQFERIRVVHHPLIFDGQKKLSKSAGATAVKNLLSDRQKIFKAFLCWLGWPHTQAPSSSTGLLELWLHERREGRKIRFTDNLQFSELVN